MSAAEHDQLKTSESVEKKPIAVVQEVSSGKKSTNEWVTVHHTPSSVIQEIPRKGKQKVSAVGGRAQRRISKFDEMQPPSKLSPNGHQVRVVFLNFNSGNGM